MGIVVGDIGLRGEIGTGRADKFAQFGFKVTIEHRDGAIAHRHAHLQDRARQARYAVKPAILTRKFLQWNFHRLGQILNDLGAAFEPEARQNRQPGAAVPRFAVIGIGCKGKRRIGIGRVGDFSKDRLARITFRTIRQRIRIAGSTPDIGFGNHGTQRAFLKNLLKTHDIGVHGEQLIGQPVLFPGVLLGGVFLEPVVLFVRTNQVFDVETGNRKIFHISTQVWPRPVETYRCPHYRLKSRQLSRRR